MVSNQKLFLYFSEQNCQPCIIELVGCIKTIFPDYEKDENIIFVSPDYPARLRRNCYGKKLLTPEKGALGISLEKMYIPFLFTLDKDLRINTLHIVDYNDISKTLQYLELIKPHLSY